MKNKRVSALLIVVALLLNSMMPVYAADGQERELQEKEIAIEEQKEETVNSGEYDNWHYTILDDGTIAITDYSGSEDNLKIPSMIEDRIVTKVADYALFEKNMCSVEVPACITCIGVSAFEYCSNLTSIEVDSDNQYYSSKDGVLYNKSQDKLICCPAGKTGEYVIPDRVVYIEMGAFSGCEISKITIGKQVSLIGSGAFINCWNLHSVTISENVKEIGNFAFGYLDIRGIGSKVENFSIYGYAGTAAETYAKENDFTFIVLEKPGETEHTWDAGKVTKEPTCTETGERTYTCTGCRETKTEEIKATGHSYGEWTIVKEATTSEEGSKERVCQKCGNKETQSIPKLPCSEWKQNSKGWWYENPDGTYPTSCWMEIDGSWYYFNASGYRVTGWQKIKNTWYYFDPATGIMYEEQWLELDGKSYYLKSGGAMATGWLELEEGWYYLNSSGVRVTDWVKSGSKWYYLDEQTGIMQANKWIDDVYYLQKDGAMATGWLELEEGWYYLNSNGKKVTGWQKISNVWYYFDPATGIMYESEWLDDTYYLKSSGAMATGWQLIGEDYYYFDASGKKLTSKWIGNYYLKADGVMARSEWVDNDRYYVDENGKWVQGKTK